MSKPIFVCYPRCTTCKKAEKWLADKGIAITVRDIKENNPTEELSAKEAELRQEMEVVSGMIQDCINENARVALDQTDFQNRYKSLVTRFDDAKAKYDAVCVEMDDKRIRRATVEQFLADLAKHDTVMTEFEPEAWHSLVDFVTVYGAEDIRITFKNGKEIKL